MRAKSAARFAKLHPKPGQTIEEEETPMESGRKRIAQFKIDIHQRDIVKVFNKKEIDSYTAELWNTLVKYEYKVQFNGLPPETVPEGIFRN